MRQITLRWLLKDGQTKLPLKWSQKNLPIPTCGYCRQQKDEFLIIGETPYCHACLQKHVEETEPKSIEEDIK